MKYGIGIGALLLLVTTLAFGQSYQPLPFPQEANTALQAPPYDQWGPSENVVMPSSMAADQGDEAFASYRYEHHDSARLGVQFPNAADPNLDRHHDEMAPEPGFGTAHDEFPDAADPSLERNR